ncbi:hypothetical protein ACHAXA_003254 [Cyclostephanos tholiformis]|uniref:Pentacotripeptide-repeat region of PRORP domain-containing protein n=1 Tax=Cyclostephanos tholiformis TaxID=382380 RepID=A0ABD3SB95_9STRA
MASSIPRLARAVALTMRHHHPSTTLLPLRRAHPCRAHPRTPSSTTIASAAGRARASSSTFGGIGASTSSSSSSSLPRDDRDEKRNGRSSGGGISGLIPVRRSGEAGGGAVVGSDGGEKRPKFEYACGGDDYDDDGLDDRARMKLAALARAREEAKSAMSSHDYDANELRERRNRAGLELARAYSQAIKYSSRLTKSESATKVAEGLLYEWMDEFVRDIGGSKAAEHLTRVVGNDDAIYDDNGGTVKDATYLNKKWMIRTANEIARRLSSSILASKLDDDDDDAVNATGNADHDVVSVRMPPPLLGDYVNLLRAYSSSKARRKGQRCEALMRNMMTLADAASRHYGDHEDVDINARTMDVSNDIGMEMVACDDDERTERWRMWVKESMPNSKVFALAIKLRCDMLNMSVVRNLALPDHCPFFFSVYVVAGPESLERIILLNQVHDGISDSCRSHVPGLYKDDPYVLLHSIKALKNFQKEEEYNLGKEWLGRLHKFVTSGENKDYFREREREHDEVDRSEDHELTRDAPTKSSSLTIDVTSAYTTVIRLMARLHGTNGVAVDAREVLDRMHAVHNLEKEEARADGGVAVLSKERKRIASIDIRSNAYNLVLGLYKDSKNVGDVKRAIELLERMVDSGRKAPEDRGGVPLATGVSFEYAITSISNMSDSQWALDEAERLIKLMHDQESIESSVVAYNSLIVVCNKQLFGKSELYDKALKILDRMDELGKTNPILLPNTETLALVMKAIALSEHKDQKKALKTASDLFLRMKEKETDQKSNVAMTDRAYYYMMKCVKMYSSKDTEAKIEEIQELFSEACQRGLCSANVLACFRSCVSDEEYRLTVGKGRLADHWIANIKSPRALYTDGSKGGAGKNARRKGKSTSDWAKRAKAREVERETRRHEKKSKKSFKKLMNSSR